MADSRDYFCTFAKETGTQKSIVMEEWNELMTWAKENFDLICLLVGLIGVVIAFISLIDEIKKKKAKKNDKKK